MKHPLFVAIAIVSLLVSTSAHAEPPYEHHVRAGISNAIAKLAAGERVTVAYLGGSITEARGYRPMTTAALRERFPSAQVHEVNAAVSGTGSLFGAFRFGREVLAHDPDLVFIEFAVNDSGVPATDVRRAMEGLVRQARAHDPSTDVVFLYTLMESYVPKLSADTLPTSMEAMEQVAERYAVPSVFLGSEVLRQIESGAMVIKAPEADDAAHNDAGRTVFSRDGVHPLNEPGHRLYAEALARFFDAAASAAAPVEPHAMPAPLKPHPLAKAKLVPIGDAQLEGGWQRLPDDHPVTAAYRDTVPAAWTTTDDDATLTFRFTGVAIGASDFTGPDSGHLLVSIDDQPPRLVERFNVWSHRYRRRFVLFANGLPPGEHILRLRIAPGPLDKAAILKSNASVLTPDQLAARRWLVADLAVAE